jgi:MoaA/NifB/PqqE/SkfB family radical SAM enzyme
MPGMPQWTKAGNLKSDFFKKTIEEIEKDLIYLTFYFQGEPYINPEFLDMVKFAHDRKIYTATSTNGHFLTEDSVIKTIDSGLDKLIISLDGTTQDIYEQYRINGKLEQVISGTKEIVKW